MTIMGTNSMRNFQQNLFRVGLEGAIGGILGSIAAIPDMVSNVLG